VPSAGGFGLNAWHAGSITSVPVAPRSRPFDVDLGTDAAGRVVATFSRCTRTPTSGFFGRPRPGTGTGCRVRVLDLASGRERDAGVPHPPRTSDTHPSMWRGRIAFARQDRRRHGDVEQVLLWSPRTRRLIALPHGATSGHCPGRGGCGRGFVSGSVQGLDLGDRLLTFLWAVEGPDVAGTGGGWEVRADRLSDRRSVRVDSGVAGEACTGGVDLVLLSTPTAEGDHVWYSARASSCYVDRVSVVDVDVQARRAMAGGTPAEIVQFANDGDALYALVAPKPAEQVQPGCDTPGAPCMLERIDQPVLAPARFARGSPFF